MGDNLAAIAKFLPGHLLAYGRIRDCQQSVAATRTIGRHQTRDSKKTRHPSVTHVSEQLSP
ncbi:MAG TPA: hypothetical protein VFZ03_02910, partial [Dongiaceae bacterium]